jgi:prepilin-type N-terminal cleavage/methylation domain-containing protein
MYHFSRRPHMGFTLIELLIVVAIIAILAAIAVPNFLEAQTRAKISRVKNDLRSISVGLESYHVDNNMWPCYMGINDPELGMKILWTQYLTGLSTPIAYLSSTTSMKDPFNPGKMTGNHPEWKWYPKDYNGGYVWREFSNKNADRNWFNMMAANYKVTFLEAFIIASYGPTRQYYYPELFILNWYVPAGEPWGFKAISNPDVVYDPSNGTVSSGNIIRAGGAAPITSL